VSSEKVPGIGKEGTSRQTSGLLVLTSHRRDCHTPDVITQEPS
jgi:hypothetical protein